MGRIAKRYAKALFNLAAGNLAEAKVDREAMEVLLGLFADEGAKKVLISPVMPLDLKKSLMTYGLDQGKASTNVRNLIETLLIAGRVAYVPQVTQAYSELIDEAEGTAKAELTTAVPIESGDERQIGDNLGRLLNKQITVNVNVDPNILGGFVAKVGNYRIDLSLRTRLDGLAYRALQEIQ